MFLWKDFDFLSQFEEADEAPQRDSQRISKYFYKNINSLQHKS